jgi:hypothetical protein
MAWFSLHAAVLKDWHQVQWSACFENLVHMEWIRVLIAFVHGPNTGRRIGGEKDSEEETGLGER